MKRVTIIFLTGLFILSVYGCAGVKSGRGSGPQTLEPSGIIRFSDVPVPGGFRAVAEKSFVLESGGVRAGVLRYTGKANVEDVIRFYKNQMPIYNWALMNVLEYGERMLNFERENESCVITINAKGRRVDVAVSLAPKSPISLPESKLETQEPQVVKPRK